MSDIYSNGIRIEFAKNSKDDRDRDKVANCISMLRATINNRIGNVLIDSEAQMPLISEHLVNKGIVRFNKVPILPVNNTIIETVTDELQKVNRQAYLTVSLELGMPLLIVKILIHDVIIETDTLTKINASTDLKNNQVIVQLINNRTYSVKLVHIETGEKCVHTAN